MSIATFKVSGIKFSIDALNQFDGRLRFKAFRIAMMACGGVIKRAVIANAPRDSGLLAKSIRVKVKIPDASYNKAHHGKPAYAVIGAGRGIFGFNSLGKTGKIGATSARTLAAATKATLAGKGLLQYVRERNRFGSKDAKIHAYLKRASRYAHFAEKGRKGKGGSRFLEKASRSSAPLAFAAFQNSLASGITEVVGQIYATQVAQQGTFTTSG